MRITDEHVLGIYSLMDELGATGDQMVSVAAVLFHGNEKHGGDDDDALLHMSHAESHFLQSGTESESGEPHAAHALARLIMAIAKIVRDSK